MQKYPYEEIGNWCNVADSISKKNPEWYVNYPLPCRHTDCAATFPCKELNEYGFLDAYRTVICFANQDILKLSPSFICSLHKQCMMVPKYKPGEYRTDLVAIRFDDHVFDFPEMISEQIHALCESLLPSLLEHHPIEVAALLHRSFVDIHPFYNGNGRIARLLMNLVLLHYHYDPLWISTPLRHGYIDALNSDRRGETTGAFPLFISKNVAINQIKKRSSLIEKIPINNINFYESHQ